MKTDIQKGFYWHVHHRIIVEFCHDYEGRVLYIRTKKEKHERDTRLRLCQPVKDMPQEVIEARRAYEEAEQICNEAEQAYEEAGRVYGNGKAHQACVEAWEACYNVRQAYYEALNNNMPAIIALHKEECPNCPWDGKTIFPRT